MQAGAMSAEKEIDRLEREINAKAAGGGGQGRSGPPRTTGGNSTPGRPRGGDTPLALVGILIAVAVLLPAAGRLTYDQRLALSAGAAGGAIGVAVGYVLGRRKR